MYRFDGKLYKQVDGGPIGDELSQAIARLVMIWWDNEFIVRCEHLGIDLRLYIRYVDDSNLAVVPFELGTRYENGQLIVKQELVVEDENIKSDK